MIKRTAIALAFCAANILPAAAGELGDLYIGTYGSEGCGEAVYCSVEINEMPGGYNFTYEVTDRSETVLCRDYGNLVEFGQRLIGKFGVHRGDLIWVTKEGGSILVEKTSDQPCQKSFPVNGRYWMLGN
jgi:hypothetical protein